MEAKRVYKCKYCGKEFDAPWKVATHTRYCKSRKTNPTNSNPQSEEVNNANNKTGGVSMDIQEKLKEIENKFKNIEQAVTYLYSKEKAKEKEESERQAVKKIEDVAHKVAEEKDKQVMSSIEKQLSERIQQIQKDIETLKSKNVTEQPKKQEPEKPKQVDYSSPEYQERIVKNVVKYAKPETKVEIFKHLTEDDFRCIFEGVCKSKEQVKKLRKAGFVINVKEEQPSEKAKEEKKEEQQKETQEEEKRIIL